MICEIIHKPFLLILIAFIYVVIFWQIDKRLIKRMKITDSELVDRAVQEPNVDREWSHSEKNEEIVRNLFFLTLKKPFSKWQGIHFAVFCFQVFGWSVALYYVYLILIGCS